VEAHYAGCSRLRVAPPSALPLWQDVRRSLDDHDILPANVVLDPEDVHRSVLAALPAEDWWTKFGREIVPQWRQLAELAQERIPLRIAESKFEDARACERIVDMASSEVAKLTDPMAIRPRRRDEIELVQFMLLEQADIWLGFSPEQIDGYFGQAGLVDYGYASLGMQ